MEFGEFTHHAPAGSLDRPSGDRNERELAGLLADGRIAPHIGATFPLADTARAFERVPAGRAVGKVVIDVTA
ncbi:zinc-binding dehydrogenase [Nocardia sp. NPDC002869]|uniref:zinc-binding dehydrogenase n=1 Tax=Nocardia sp. NPDC002869 TaxID=3161032 RepID=UPI00398D390D